MVLPPEEREGILGDFAEEYSLRHRRGETAGRWYTSQALTLAARFAWERVLERCMPRAYDTAGHDERRKNGGSMEGWTKDFRIATRSLARRPGFVAIAALTLALGVGANTAIFSFLYSALLAPLPFPDPDELVWVSDVSPGGWRGNSSSIPNLLDLGRRSSSLESLTIYQGRSFNLAHESGDPERVTGLVVSPELFTTLEMPVRVGRDFTREENMAGATPVAILDHGFWERRFGSDPDIIGQTLTLNAETHTIIGVASPEVRLLRDPQVFVPFRWDEAALSRSTRNVNGIGRLTSDTRLEVANLELRSLYARLADEYPESNEDWSVAATPYRDYGLGASQRKQIILLLGATGLVLLIACVNVTNLLLARAEVRGKEMAVRAALGAARGRLAALFLSESLLLAGLGGSLGLAGAFAGIPLLERFFDSGLGGNEPAGMSEPVLAFGLGAALLCGLLVGLIPGLTAQVKDIQKVLREGGRGATGAGGRLRRGLVVVEVALAVTIVAGAGLLLRSFWAVSSVELGLEDPDQVLVFSVAPPTATYPDATSVAEFYSNLVTGLERLPQVESAGVTSRMPLNGGTNVTEMYANDNPDRTSGFVEIRTVTANYLEAAGIKLLRGRALQPGDEDPEGGHIVISQELARQLFPEEDPLGKQITVWNGYSPTVVGVAADTRGLGPTRAPPPLVYFHVGGQFQPNQLLVMTRARGNPLDLVADARQVLSGLDATVPVFDIRVMGDVVSQTVGRGRRSSTSLVVMFGALALFLGAVGIYGVMSYFVAQRTREIGVRIALGARSGEVTGLILRQGVRMTALGVGGGVIGAIFAGRLLASMLYEVRAVDPLTHGSVAVLMAVVAISATWIPARRASRIAPTEAFREDG